MAGTQSLLLRQRSPIHAIFVPSGRRILELGCGEGQLPRSLRPSHGVGVDLSQEMINLARKHAPEFEFHVGNAEDPELLDSIVGPFDDFDLIFDAAKLNLKIVEGPVRYADRTYGETQISRFRDGWLLLRMVALARRKL